jgi:hypothetical protein
MRPGLAGPLPRTQARRSTADLIGVPAGRAAARALIAAGPT